MQKLGLAGIAETRRCQHNLYHLTRPTRHGNSNLIGVFTGNSGSDDMSFRQWLVTRVDEVNNAVSPWLLTVQDTDIFDAIQWYAHRYLSTQATYTPFYLSYFQMNIGYPVAVLTFLLHFVPTGCYKQQPRLGG